MYMHWHKVTAYIVTNKYTINTKLLPLHCGSRTSSQDNLEIQGNLENVNVFLARLRQLLLLCVTT